MNTKNAVGSTSETHCVDCDYDLRGIPEPGLCPECGSPVFKSLPLPFHREDAERLRVGSMAVLVASVVLSMTRLVMAFHPVIVGESATALDSMIKLLCISALFLLGAGIVVSSAALEPTRIGSLRIADSIVAGLVPAFVFFWIQSRAHCLLLGYFTPFIVERTLSLYPILRIRAFTKQLPSRWGSRCLRNVICIYVCMGIAYPVGLSILVRVLLDNQLMGIKDAYEWVHWRWIADAPLGLSNSLLLAAAIVYRKCVTSEVTSIGK